MPTRIVWMTLLAAMDETGYCHFAAPANVAHRARVTLDDALTAIHTLENPDPDSSNPANEGRRIERVPGGWMVLNSGEHRKLITKAIIQEQTRDRVKRFRERLKRNSNALVTPSEAIAVAKEEAKQQQDPGNSVGVNHSTDPHTRNSGKTSASAANNENGQTEKAQGTAAAKFIDRFCELYSKHRNGARYHVKPSLDWTRVCDLLNTYPAERLEKLAAVLLTTDEDWVQKTDRGIGVLVARVSWCEDRLSAWEAQNGVKA